MKWELWTENWPYGFFYWTELSVGGNWGTVS